MPVFGVFLDVLALATDPLLNQEGFGRTANHADVPELCPDFLERCAHRIVGASWLRGLLEVDGEIPWPSPTSTGLVRTDYLQRAIVGIALEAHRAAAFETRFTLAVAIEFFPGHRCPYET